MRSQLCEASSLVSQLIIDNTDISAPAKAESSSLIHTVLPATRRRSPVNSAECPRLTPPAFPQALHGQERANLELNQQVKGPGRCTLHSDTPPHTPSTLPGSSGFRGAVIFALPRRQVLACVKAALLFLTLPPPSPPPPPSAISCQLALVLARPSAGAGLSLSSGKPQLQSDGILGDGGGRLFALHHFDLALVLPTTFSLCN